MHVLFYVDFSAEKFDSAVRFLFEGLALGGSIAGGIRPAGQGAGGETRKFLADAAHDAQLGAGVTGHICASIWGSSVLLAWDSRTSCPEPG